MGTSLRYEIGGLRYEVLATDPVWAPTPFKRALTIRGWAPAVAPASDGQRQPIGRIELRVTEVPPDVRVEHTALKLSYDLGAASIAEAVRTAARLASSGELAAAFEDHATAGLTAVAPRADTQAVDALVARAAASTVAG